MKATLLGAILFALAAVVYWQLSDDEKTAPRTLHLEHSIECDPHIIHAPFARHDVEFL